MQYPATLLPQTRFKRIVCDLSDHHICRASPTRDFINPVTSKLFDEALFEKSMDFFDYSTNHLGQFEVDFNFFSLCGNERKYFRAYWDFESEVKTPLYEQDFIYNNQKGIFYFKIGDIHKKIEFPLESNAKNKADKLTAIVKHTPSHSNFWHFSIRWIDGEDKEISANDSNWKNRIIATIRAKLQEIFIVTTPFPNPIPIIEYTK